MQKFFSYIVIAICSIAAFSSCGSSDEPAPPVSKTAHRTVLVYMLADNNLGTVNMYDSADLLEMDDGVRNGALNGGHLIVYHNRPHTNDNNPPQLLEITPEGTKVLKTYSDNLYSVEAERMKQVLADMKSLAPADEYGLVLWGHATAWMTENGDIDQRPRSYGSDRDKWMSLSSLGNVLSAERFAFIYFDCCLMGTVEVAYELREATPLIAGSPTELEGEGQPYQLNIPEFFKKGQADVIQAAKNTYEYLKVNGYKRAVQMTVIKTAALPELAAASREIFANLSEYHPQLNSVQSLSQSFDWGKPLYRTTCPVYDMEDYMKCISAGEPELLADWQSALNDCILYKATTERDYTGINIRTYCGLGSFIIKKPEDINYRGYTLTKWWADVVSAAPLYK